MRMSRTKSLAMPKPRQRSTRPQVAIRASAASPGLGRAPSFAETLAVERRLETDHAKAAVLASAPLLLQLAMSLARLAARRDVDGLRQ